MLIKIDRGSSDCKGRRAKRADMKRMSKKARRSLAKHEAHTSSH